MMFDRIEKGLYWDRLWRLVDGCAPCSPGCERCWSARYTHRFDARYVGQPPGDVDAYEHAFTDGSRFNGIVRLRHDKLELPLRTKKPQAWLILNDLFHEDVPQASILGMRDIMSRAENHIFLVLTKRINRAVEFWGDKKPIKNIWIGVTVCSQQEADEKIPLLLQIPVAVRWVSLEPMLGKIDLSKWIWEFNENYQPPRFLDEGERYNVNPNIPSDEIQWVIIGGETGPGARPMHPDWARSVRDQCQAAGVPFFFKGWGEWYPAGEKGISKFKPITKDDSLDRLYLWPDREISMRVGKKAAGRLLDGREYSELPKGVK